MTGVLILILCAMIATFIGSGVGNLIAVADRWLRDEPMRAHRQAFERRQKEDRAERRAIDRVMIKALNRAAKTPERRREHWPWMRWGDRGGQHGNELQPRMDDHADERGGEDDDDAPQRILVAGGDRLRARLADQFRDARVG